MKSRGVYGLWAKIYGIIFDVPVRETVTLAES